VIPLTSLPTLNAVLNALSALLLVTGYVFIRRKQIQFHKWCMLSALGTSTLFLTSYLFYHYHIGSRPFVGQGPIRMVYFAILISHTVLAAAIVPLVLITVATPASPAAHCRSGCMSALQEWSFIGCCTACKP